MTFAIALDGRFQTFGNVASPSVVTSPNVPAQQVQQPDVQNSPSISLFDTSKWDQVFGKDARLIRNSSDPNSPFRIKTQGETEKRDGQQIPGAGAGIWQYNPRDNAFYFYPMKGDDGTLMGARPWESLLPYQEHATKRIPATALGLGEHARWEIAGLATLAGKNNDPWSHYALTHNNYDGKGIGNPEGVMSGAAQLRGAVNDINSYESKGSGFDQFLEAAVIGGIATIATMGFGAPLAASMQAAGWSAGTAAVASNAIVGAAAGGTTAAVTGGDPLKGALLGGAGGAIGGYSSTLSKTGGLLSPSNMVNTAGKTALAAVSGGDPVATLASSVAGSAAGAATDSPFVGQLASQATRQLVGNHSAQAAQQPRTAQTSSTKNTQSTQSTPGASFAYALPSFKYTDLSKRGNA